MTWRHCSAYAGSVQTSGHTFPFCFKFFGLSTRQFYLAINMVTHPLQQSLVLLSSYMRDFIEEMGYRFDFILFSLYPIILSFLTL